MRAAAAEPLYPLIEAMREGCSGRLALRLLSCSSRMAFARLCAAFWSMSVVLISLSLIFWPSSVDAFGPMKLGSAPCLAVGSTPTVGGWTTRPVSCE